jgi:hypothetical protein
MGAIAIGVLCWSIFQIQEQAHRTDLVIADARRFALEVQQCQREFNTALKARSQITADNDRLSQVQRTAIASWLHTLLFPPEPYASMSRDDERYKRWAIDITTDYYDILEDAQHEQMANDRERANHPYPEPLCGN